ncbi:hypothetical protein CNR22_23075 [Sphingobacteriaceae bacterium]|nr:hypothetical protein CNR22_23075 [Sphingobacteriaceae bacterium]
MQMKNVYIFLLALISSEFCAQNPKLKIYIDTVEFKNKEKQVSATVKIGKNNVAILSPEQDRIMLPADMDVRTIEAITFIVCNDTITFSVNKILEGTDISSESVRLAALNIIFHSVKRWELRVSGFSSEADKKEKGTEKNTGKFERKNAQSKNFKIYALRTISWKYYIVKV